MRGNQHCCCFPFFVAVFSKKKIENMSTLFLSSYTNTHESLGELEKAVDIPAARVYTAFSFSQISTRFAIPR